MSEALTATQSTTETRLPAGFVKFPKCEGFTTTLKKRVDQYFVDNQLSRRDHPRMYLKTAIILSWLVASYVGLVFYASNVWQALGCAVSLGITMAAVGFNIQHDGGHGAYSRFPIVNGLMAFTLDILGGSSFIWKRTHNVIHHSFTNVTGVDNDIELGILGRLSPHQPHRSFHRFQHLYLWFLYGFITFKWQFVDDTRALLTRKIGESKVPMPSLGQLAVLLLGKAIFLTLAFGLPLAQGHPWYAVLGCFVAASFVQGVLLSVVFQLAHCVEEAEFPLPDETTEHMENAWTIHQIETTVDFARRKPLATWFTGGLNYQIEHHVFPQICHLHYPAIADIVEETSKEFGVNYNAHGTSWAAIRSHYNWLKKMGQSA